MRASKHNADHALHRRSAFALVGARIANSTTGYPGPPHIVRTERNIPDYTVALEEDAKVISADGKHVGNVERVITSSAKNIATHFLISKGVLFKVHKLVPVSWVDRVEEEEIHLAVGSGLLQELPEYEE